MLSRLKTIAVMLGVVQAKPYLAKGAAVTNVARCAKVYFGKTVTEWGCVR